MTSKTIELTRKDYNLIAKNRGIKEPQYVFTNNRYDSKRKVKNNRKKLLKIKLEKSC